MGVRGLFLKKEQDICKQNLTKERNLVISQLVIVWNVFILCLWVGIIRSSYQSV